MEPGITGPVAIGHLAGKLISVLFFCVCSRTHSTRSTTLVISGSSTPAVEARQRTSPLRL